MPRTDYSLPILSYVESRSLLLVSALIASVVDDTAKAVEVAVVCSKTRANRFGFWAAARVMFLSRLARYLIRLLASFFVVYEGVI